MRVARVVSALRWASHYMSFNRRVRLVALLLPRRLWYRAALAASWHHGRLAAFAGSNGRLTEAIMLDHWLRELTVSGAFPIPWTMRERSGLETCSPQRGVLFCWTHSPLAEIPLRAFVELGFPPPTVIADAGNISPDGHLSLPGLSERAPAILADAHSLLHMRTILRAGGGVVCLADQVLGGPLSPRAMKVAARVGARVVFQWAERRPDGVLDVSFIHPPCPDCASDAEIETNLRFLEDARRRLLASSDPRAWERPSPAIDWEPRPTRSAQVPSATSPNLSPSESWHRDRNALSLRQVNPAFERDEPGLSSVL